MDNSVTRGEFDVALEFPTTCLFGHTNICSFSGNVRRLSDNAQSVPFGRELGATTEKGSPGLSGDPLRQYSCESTGRHPQSLTARFTLAFGPWPFDAGFLDTRSRRTLVAFGTGLFGTRRYRLGMGREPVRSPH